MTQPSKPKSKSSTDWSEVHRRLERARAATEGGRAPSPEEKKKILKARAKALARAARDQGAPEEQIEVVEFLLAHEKYAVESSYVREVYPLKDFATVPGTPPFVLGLVNVRGQILSVIDIKKFFDLPEKGLTDLNRVIVLSDDRMEFGILCDAILGARSVPVSELQPSLPTLTGIRAEYLKGITTERVVILDAERLLSDKKMIVEEKWET